MLRLSCPASAKVFNLYLKAFACGARGVTCSVAEFMDRFKVTRSTYYRHLSLLATSAVLRYESPGSRTTGLTWVEFLVDPSQQWESPKIETVPKMGLAYSSSGFNSSSSKNKDSAAEELNHSLDSQDSALQEKNSPKNETPSPKNETASPKNETRPNIFGLYEANIGPLTPLIAEKLLDAEKEYPEPWIRETFQIAVDYNKRSWAYCESILKRWQSQGKDSGRRKPKPGAEAEESFVESQLRALEARDGRA